MALKATESLIDQGPPTRGADLRPEAAEPPSRDPDADLVAAACGGDRAAFEALLRRHYDRLYRVAWRFTGSTADAEDIAQDVCCALVDKLSTFRGKAKFTTWLVGVVLNACRDRRRRDMAAARLKRSYSIVAGLVPGPDGRDGQRSIRVANAIGKLDPHLRDTLNLVIGEEMSHAEAALALGVKEATVSWRIHQARRLLANMIPEIEHGL